MVPGPSSSAEEEGRVGFMLRAAGHFLPDYKDLRSKTTAGSS